MITVCELFKSIQGEGSLVGVPAAFIRISGCNLRCKWCDAKFSSHVPSGTDYSIDELVNFVLAYNCQHVVITGGEPMLHPKIIDLTRQLAELGLHITVETNGTLLKEVSGDLISISPKLSHSESDSKCETKRINIRALKYYINNYDYQLKFVVRENKDDINEINRILKNIGIYDPTKIFLMPLASTREELYKIQEAIVQLCIEYGFRFANRLQLQIWDGKDGK